MRLAFCLDFLGSVHCLLRSAFRRTLVRRMNYNVASLSCVAAAAATHLLCLVERLYSAAKPFAMRHR